MTDRIGSPSTAAIKVACRVATTANITLSGLQTIDGVAVASGDRVLVRIQDDSVENGIYEANTSTWQRARDADGARDFVRGTVVNVYAGTTLAAWYEVLSSDPIVIGTSAITFQRWLLTAG